MSEQKTYRPRKRPTQTRARITFDSILEATAHILAESGYPSLNTNEIAGKAGVSIGSLYQYFPNKEAIIASLIEREVNRDVEYLNDLFQEIRDLPLRRAVNRIVDAIMDRCESDVVLATALREQIPRVDWTKNMRAAASHLESRLGDLLEDRFPNARPDKIRETAFIVVHAIDGIVNSVLFQRPDWLGNDRFRASVSGLVVRQLEALAA